MLSEFYVVATRKFDPPTPERPPVGSSGPTRPGRSSRSTGPLILATLEDRTLSFWDALIIEAAARGGAARLSEDLQAKCRIRGVTIGNPFAGP